MPTLKVPAPHSPRPPAKKSYLCGVLGFAPSFIPSMKSPLLFLLFFSTSLLLHAQPHFVLQAIQISGNKRTRPEVITREMTIQLGESVALADTASLRERNQFNIYNLRLFNVVNCHFEVADSAAGSLVFHVFVKERWYFFPVPGLAIEERNSYDFLEKMKYNLNHPLREWQVPRMSGYLGIGWGNMTGRNNSLYFWGQAGFSNRLEVGYFHPWLFPEARIDAFGGVKYHTQKQLIYGTEQGKPLWGRTEQSPLMSTHKVYLGVRKRFTPFKSLFVDLVYSRFTFHDSIYQYQRNYLSNNSAKEHYPSVIIVFNNDRRDVKTFPTQGFRYRLLGRFSGGLPGSSTTFAKIGYSVAHYVPLSRNQRWLLAYGSQTTHTFGRKIPFYEKSTVWIDKDEFPEYYNDLRGYERYAIDGTTINLNKVELKYAVFPRKIVHVRQIPFKKFQDLPLGVYVALFGENGNVWDRSISNSDTFLKNRALYGYGIGLHLITFYDNLIRMEVAGNHLNQWGFNFHAIVPIK